MENLLAQYIKELQISEELFSLACKQHNSTIDGVEVCEIIRLETYKEYVLSYQKHSFYHGDLCTAQ